MFFLTIMNIMIYVIKYNFIPVEILVLTAFLRDDNLEKKTKIAFDSIIINTTGTSRLTHFYVSI